MQEDKTNNISSWTCIYILSSFNLIAVFIDILLLIDLLKSKPADFISFVLQLEIIISCLIHQFAYTPTYDTYINTSAKKILCNTIAFLDNTTNILAMTLGVTIAFLLFRSSSGKPLKSLHVFLISVLCCFFFYYYQCFFCNLWNSRYRN